MSADLDREIDRAVRQMLDVEPPVGLRARVMARIENPGASGFSRKLLWIAMPVAAAAVILIAVVLARREGPAPSPAPTTLPSIVKVTPGPQLPTSTQAPAGPPRTVTAENRPPVVAPPREAQRVAATAVVESAPAEGFPQVPALSIPELSVPDIRSVAAVSAPAQLGVDPIATPASIEIEPLPLSPRERQNQE
jgi:hypothetical protein